MCGCGVTKFCPGGCDCGCDHDTINGLRRQATHFAAQYEWLQAALDRVMRQRDDVNDRLDAALAAIVALPRNLAGDEHYVAVELALHKAEQIVQTAIEGES